MDPPRTPPTLSQVHLAEVGTCDACLRSGRQRLNVGLALGVTLPGAYLGLALFAGLPHPELTPPLEALAFGLAVVGAAFVLSWAAELAALEISAGLAISVLALVAVLPEYAVDFVFAWRGGNAVQANGTCEQDGQDPCSLALANMTGANRLLIGIGWALVVLLAWFRFRRQGRPRGGIQLPLVFAVAAGTATGLPVGPAQREELLLTAAQSLFAVAVLVNLAISAREAAALSGLFLVQFALAALVPGATELIVLAVTYLVLAAVLLLRARRRLGPLLRDGLRTPYHQLTDQRGAAPRPGGHRPAGAERREGPS